MALFSISQRRACRLVAIDRSSARYQARSVGGETVLRGALEELAQRHPRYGYRRLWVELHRGGYAVNHKRVYRLYRQARLKLRRQAGRRLTHRGVPLAQFTRPNQQWALDFVHDRIGDGRALRVLTIIDEFTRECLATEVDTGISSRQVARVLARILESRSTPLSRCAATMGPSSAAATSTPGARASASSSSTSRRDGRCRMVIIESFNGKLRDECLNLNCLRNLNDARERIGRWREHYNSSRPHSALGYLAPAQFAAQWNAALTRTAAPGSLALAVQSAAPPIQNRHFFASPLNPVKGEDEKMLNNNSAQSLIMGGR
jgi:putative transposase